MDNFIGRHITNLLHSMYVPKPTLVHEAVVLTFVSSWHYMFHYGEVDVRARGKSTHQEPCAKDKNWMFGMWFPVW